MINLERFSRISRDAHPRRFWGRFKQARAGQEPCSPGCPRQRFLVEETQCDSCSALASGSALRFFEFAATALHSTQSAPYVFGIETRSEERRVGKECRSRWA